jgi:hypothetical protein
VQIGPNVVWVWNVVPSTSPKCSCGCSAPPTIRANDDGSLWAPACWERELRRRAIAHAENHLTGLFLAVAPEARSRLYRGLAAAFHPDAGGDPALMIALNAVRDRFPKE